MADITSTAPDYAPDADTWDHVVRAVGHMGYAGACALLMRATRAHAHDAELLWLTRAVRSRAPGLRGETLLLRAARSLRADRVAEILAACPTLLQRQQLLRARGVWGTSALHAACMYFRSDCESANLRPNEAYEGRVLALVDVLLGAGADPDTSESDSRGNRGDRPLLLAAHWSEPLVRRLVAAGGRLMRAGLSFTFADEYSDFGDDGDSGSADSDSGGGDSFWGRSLLAIAATSTSYSRDETRASAVDTLVALGVRSPPDDDWLTHCARSRSFADSSPATVRAVFAGLVRSGCSLTLPSNRTGDTPLETAMRHDNQPVVRALLQLGAPATGQIWVLAVMLDAQQERDRVAWTRLLLSEPSVRVAGHAVNTALMAAARRCPAAVHLLLHARDSQGARVVDVACSNERGEDALMCAVQCAYGTAGEAVDVLAALLAAGAQVSARDGRGWGVLHHLAHAACGAPWAAAAAQLVCERGAAQHRARDGRFPFEVPPAAGGACTCGLHAGLLAGAAATAAAVASYAAGRASAVAAAACAAEAEAADADVAAQAAAAAALAAQARAQTAIDREATALAAAPLASPAAQSPGASGPEPS